MDGESATVEWLEHDEVSKETLARLPGWSLEGGETVGRVHVVRAGLIIREGERVSAVPWALILTTVRQGEVLYLCAPRQPPRAPYFELSGDADYAQLERRIEERERAQKSYRDGPTAKRAPLALEVVLTRVLNYLDLPGAVEIALNVPAPNPLTHSMLGLAGGLGVGAQLGIQLHSLVAFIAGTAILGGGFGATMYWHFHKKYLERPRVLVMTPDAFVAGLDGGAVRAHAWSSVSAFRAGTLHGNPALEVLDPAGQVLARVEARLLDAPLPLVIALAEAYRTRVA